MRIIFKDQMEFLLISFAVSFGINSIFLRMIMRLTNTLLKKKLAILLLAILAFPSLSRSQTIVNNYLKVIQVLGDRVSVESSSEIDLFLPGDKVMLIQMTGGEKGIDIAQYRTDMYTGIKQCGKFEILQVAEIQKIPEYRVLFTDSIDNTYNNDERLQLVRIPESDKYVVNSKVTAKEWDGNSGGIIAIIGHDTIDLQADIDASGNGFRGGQAENIPSVTCRTWSPDTVNWTESETGRAGHKGEGIISTGYIYTRGPSNALNGGGSGYGMFTGGGGGSNYQAGGRGGNQMVGCGETDTTADGGFNQKLLFRLFCNPLSRRIVMGGGGGAGTQDIAAGHNATPGGDGGGIILLITETLIGSGGALKSNGQSITTVASGSGGGGGAGGTILVDAARYHGSFTVEAKGGDGGPTNDNCTGAGGSGSGGILWYSGASLFPGATVSTSLSAGQAGKSNGTICGSTTQYGKVGMAGGTEDLLLLILNGFLFNTVHGIDTICAGQQPKLLTGSNPKGGDGSYAYQWIQSTDQSTWVNASGTSNQKDYQPPVLTQTTYYKRVVSSKGIVDNSLPLEVYVYDAITGNIISGTDTLCYGNTAKTITGSVPAVLKGGNGAYSYQWYYSANGSTWNTITNATLPDYSPGQLLAKRYYRRYVRSTQYCSHTSDSVFIHVLQKIAANLFFTSDTTICRTLSPGNLNANPRPAGGDSKYRYAWLQKPGSSGWNLIAGAHDSLYNPGPLNETTSYKRIVYSGNDDACIDTTSPAKLVTVLPLITGNLISIDSSKYCAGDHPEIIDGQVPNGGDIGNYMYRWQLKTTASWSNISGATDEDCSPPVVETHTQYRRIVSSGLLNAGDQFACHDTSSVLSLEVIPYIINNLGLEDQTICQGVIPLPFNPEAATGGYGGITYQWKMQEEGLSTWQDAPGISASVSYTSDSLEKTTYFLRMATSDICEQSSDTVTVTVYQHIHNNNLAGSPVSYTCFNASEALSGPGYSGGNGDYAFLWQQSTDNISWQTASGTSATLADFETVALTDSLLVRRIIYSSAAERECKDTSAPVTIRINPLPSGDIVSASDTVCTNGSAYISFHLSGIHGPWDVTVGEGTFRQSKTGITATYDSISLAFTENHTVHMLEIRDDSSCYADPSAFGHAVQVKVYEYPDADAGQGGVVCGNQFALNAAALPLSYKGLWTVPGGSFADSTTAATSITLDPGNFGKVYARWTVNNWKCSDWDTAGIMFYEQPVMVEAGPDQTLDFIYETGLEATIPSVGRGHWNVVQGTGVVSNDTLYNAMVSELDARNLLRWTITNGVCKEIKDSVEITVNLLKVPKGFSPNNDQINDKFVIPTDNAEKISIMIFNRAGVLVFESEDYTQGDLWTGQSKNKLELPEGTYFYIMDIWVKGKTQPLNFKSFVEILR
jgi:gliding motility-associated-like protein